MMPQRVVAAVTRRKYNKWYKLQRAPCPEHALSMVILQHAIEYDMNAHVPVCACSPKRGRRQLVRDFDSAVYRTVTPPPLESTFALIDDLCIISESFSY